MIFTQKEIEDIRREDYPDGVDLVEETSWVADHKFQHKSIYVAKAGSIYVLHYLRSESPFTDYEYEDPCPEDVFEVEKAKVTITTWIPKK